MPQCVLRWSNHTKNIVTYMKYVNIFYTPGLGKLSWNSLWFDKVGETCHTTVRLICHQILHHSMLQIFWKIVGLIWLTIWELLNKDLDVGLCPSGGHKTIRMYTRFVCMLVKRWFMWSGLLILIQALLGRTLLPLYLISTLHCDK